jgi:hypothetical protein
MKSVGKLVLFCCCSDQRYVRAVLKRLAGEVMSGLCALFAGASRSLSACAMRRPARLNVRCIQVTSHVATMCCRSYFLAIVMFSRQAVASRQVSVAWRYGHCAQSYDVHVLACGGMFL